MTNDNRKLKRLWISMLMVASWVLCLVTVNYPEDHVLGFSPILMYVFYSLMTGLSLAALAAILLKKPLLSDVLAGAVLPLYFVLFGIVLIKRLLLGYVLFFPLMTISLFVSAGLALTIIVLLIITRKKQGYLLSIIAYSIFLFVVVMESYPVAYEEVTEVYGNLKLVYFVAIITAAILGIIHASKSYKEIKEKPPLGGDQLNKH
ncbi:MAG: hypothetical protein WC344_00910 [Bacilli bacterium]